ncbi:hypothetical protein L9F63_024834, partial [Diploptera punctata]
VKMGMICFPILQFYVKTIEKLIILTLLKRGIAGKYHLCGHFLVPCLPNISITRLTHQGNRVTGELNGAFPSFTTICVSPTTVTFDRELFRHISLVNKNQLEFPTDSGKRNVLVNNDFYGGQCC